MNEQYYFRSVKIWRKKAHGSQYADIYNQIVDLKKEVREGQIRHQDALATALKSAQHLERMVNDGIEPEFVALGQATADRILFGLVERALVPLGVNDDSVKSLVRSCFNILGQPCNQNNFWRQSPSETGAERTSWRGSEKAKPFVTFEHKA